MKLEDRIRIFGIEPDDVIENFIRGSGKGGQKINKTSSRVQLIHQPTGIIVTCQQERSQNANRLLAWRMLCDRLELHQRKEALAAQQAVEKARRRNRKRSFPAKQTMLKEKRRRGEKKKLRRKPVVE